MDTFGPNAGPPQSGSECWFFDREEMSAVQLRALSDLVLIPIDDACTADGYSYYELSVTNDDGAVQSYRTTGCSYLRLPGATALIPQDFFTSSFPLAEGESCSGE